MEARKNKERGPHILMERKCFQDHELEDDVGAKVEQS